MNKLNGKIFIFLLLTGFAAIGTCRAESVIKLQNNRVVLENKYLERTIYFGKDGIYTGHFINRITGKDYSKPGSLEFGIKINNTHINGLNINQFFTLDSIRTDSSLVEYKKLMITYSGRQKSGFHKTEMILEYLLYDEYPVIRKRISIRNNSSKELIITNLNIEDIAIQPVYNNKTSIYGNYGGTRFLLPYTGRADDPAILIFNEDLQEGFIVGNECPGMLKRSGVYDEGVDRITLGMNRENEQHPFKKFLASGSNFSSPWVFIYMYKGEKWQDAFEGSFRDFSYNHLALKASGNKNIPHASYCTWIPFRHDINTVLVKELIDGLEGTGIDLFIIDDGWFVKAGDWDVDYEKFPGGLKAVSEYAADKGIKLGLWFSLSTVDKNSKVLKEHPEWAIRDEDGNFLNLHNSNDKKVTMSMASDGYYNYIFNRLKECISEWNLAYIKLDFATAVSAYRTADEFSGDSDPKGDYKDKASSYYSLYEATGRFLDDLTSEFPDLVIDGTFELWGKKTMLDYSLLQHADVVWLTNYTFPSPKGPIAIRQVVNDRGRVMPPKSMFIGNQRIEDENYKFVYSSLAASSVIFCGDPRKLSNEQKLWYRKMTAWFREMELKYDYTDYYSKSDIFDRPSFSNWDGCFRFNPDKQGGVLFFYRNDSPDQERSFPVNCVDRASKYRVFEPVTNSEFGVFTGEQLIEQGLRVKISERNQSQIFGIEKIYNK